MCINILIITCASSEPKMIAGIFSCITFLTAVFLYLATGKNKRILSASLFIWIAIGILSFAGFFQNIHTTPPRFLLVMVMAIIFTICCYRITTVTTLKPTFLIAIHTLRIPVELVLYQLYQHQKIPQLMTFEGWNFDVLVGLSALPILMYVWMKKPAFDSVFWICWNILGVIFLLIIISLAILCSPLPFQQLAFDQPNIAVLEFPFVFLPAYVVPVVLTAHLLAFKKKGTKVSNQTGDIANGNRK